MAIDVSALAARGAALAFGLVGAGSLEAVTFHLQRAAGTYDPATDEHTPAAGVERTVGVLPYKRKNQNPETTQIVERKFTTDTETLLVQDSDLGGASISESDTVTRADGEEWAILLVQPVPPNNPAIWLVDVRR
jgi:hypothetical protein